MTDLSARSAHSDALLARQLSAVLGEEMPAATAYLRERLQWIDVAGGEVLLEQGEPGAAGYLVISGRLRVYVRDGDGAQRMVREVSRGALIGEMSLYTGEPRSATVVAVRNSVLVKLEQRDFEELLAISPQVSISFTRQIIHRLQTEHLRKPLPAPVTVAVLPITEGVDIATLVPRLAQELRRFGTVCMVDAAEIARLVAPPGAAQGEKLPDAAVAAALDALEAEHDFVLLQADAEPGAWTRSCVSHADEILLLVDASCTPEIHLIEQTCLVGRPARSEAAEILVLLHPSDQVIPRGTRNWLVRRPVTAHVHIRPELERDLARLARLVSRNAIGLVFAGGGARGFAHLGTWRALHDQGVEIDCVGGTSIGGVLAAMVAADPPIEKATGIARKAFSENPTGDFNLLPLMSLIKGGRVRSAIERSLRALIGEPIDIEDLWKTYFCIATNYSQAREQPVKSGDLARAMRASIAIPGALPPVVHDGDLLCDGGTFNNFPVDVMRDLRGVGTVLGVDLGARVPRRLEFDEMPSSWALLRDRFRPRHKRRYRLPSLAAYLLNTTILYSISRQPEARRLTDIYFCPPLHRVGLLQWSRFDEIVRQGHDHAVEVLDALNDKQRAGLGISRTS